MLFTVQEQSALRFVFYDSVRNVIYAQAHYKTIPFNAAAFREFSTIFLNGTMRGGDQGTIEVENPLSAIG